MSFASGNKGTGGALPKPSRYERAVRFHEDLNSNWRKNFKTIPIIAPKTGVPFSSDWLTNQNQFVKDEVKLYEVEGKKNLQRIYPYTHVLPQEERYKIQADMMKPGTPLAYAPDGSGMIMGKAYAGPEFFDYKAQELKRGLALAYDQWKLNQIDISTLVKKEYWAKKDPVLYQKVMEGGRRNLELEFKKGLILLEGPKTEADWKFLYEHVIHPKYGAAISQPYSTPTPPLPGMFSYGRKNMLNTNNGPDTIQDNQLPENAEAAEEIGDLPMIENGEDTTGNIESDQGIFSPTYNNNT